MHLNKDLDKDFVAINKGDNVILKPELRSKNPDFDYKRPQKYMKKSHITLEIKDMHKNPGSNGFFSPISQNR